MPNECSELAATLSSSGRVVQRQPLNDKGGHEMGGKETRRHHKEVGGMGTIWKQSGSQQQVGISRPPLGRVRPIPTTCLPGLGLGLLHDDRSGLNALPVQPGPSPRRAMMRQAARRDMQPAVSVSCLNAAACIGMDDERVTARVRVRVIAQAVAARVLSPLADQISRRISTRPHRRGSGGSGRTRQASFARYQDHL